MRRPHAYSPAGRGRPSKRIDRPDRPQHVPMCAAASNSPFSSTSAHGASAALIHIVLRTGSPCRLRLEHWTRVGI